MPDLTTTEMRARLEELCEDLRRLATMPPLQRIGNVGMRIVIGEQWILDLALETLARREREERLGRGIASMSDSVLRMYGIRTSPTRRSRTGRPGDAKTT